MNETIKGRVLIRNRYNFLSRSPLVEYLRIRTRPYSQNYLQHREINNHKKAVSLSLSPRLGPWLGPWGCCRRCSRGRSRGRLSRSARSRPRRPRSSRGRACSLARTSCTWGPCIARGWWCPGWGGLGWSEMNGRRDESEKNVLPVGNDKGRKICNNRFWGPLFFYLKKGCVESSLVERKLYD